jgi:phosphopantetheinyl transferase (holo-ACP synthase)
MILDSMKLEGTYKKIVSRISREQFGSFFSSCKPEEWFSEEEICRFVYPSCAGSLAGRYLIKKIIGDFIGDYKMLNEIEILNDDNGRPVITLGENIEKIIMSFGIKRIECSISHSRNYFACMTILCF